MKTKALLLSAGFGTRLRPITNNIPKCLVRINNIPILEHWLLKLENLGIDEVLVNKHYLAKQVEEFLRNQTKKEDLPKEEEATEKDQEQWQKITENYLKNIDELKSQSMCLHWFNRNKDVLKNMKVVVPRMYGEIQEHYERKLESLKL